MNKISKRGVNTPLLQSCLDFVTIEKLYKIWYNIQKRGGLLWIKMALSKFQILL